jgi:hypothetical protein
MFNKLLLLGLVNLLCKMGHHDMNRGGWRWRSCRNCNYHEEV